MGPPERRHPSAVNGGAVVIAGRQTTSTTVPASDDVATQRRRRRECDFDPDTVAWLEMLDRRAAAEQRLAPLADLASAYGDAQCRDPWRWAS